MKKRIAGAAALALLVLLPGCATFLDDEASEKETALDITLSALEKKMLKARDPQGLFVKAHSYVQKQIITRGNTKTLVYMQYLAPDKYRILTLRDNAPYTAIILNGNRAWTVNYPAKNVSALPADEVERLQKLYYIGNPQHSYQSLFGQVVLKQCRIGENEYYKMTCMSKNKTLPPMIIYVGKNTFLVREIKISPPIDYKSMIKKYSLYEGVMIPDETEISSKGELSSSVINYNKLNAPLDESIFLPPIFPHDSK